jgi:hypothetical protein
MEAFDDHSVLVMVGSLNEDRDGIDMNIIAQMPPESAYELITEFMDHYRNEHLNQQDEKPGLHIVKD